MRRLSGVSSLTLALAASCLLGCTVGEGKGEVTSDRLSIEDCWDGPFDLYPTFFAANPYREEMLMIRVQRGDNIEEMSDGLLVLVNDLKSLPLDEPVPVGLPPGIELSGTPSTGEEPGALGDPPLVSLALYLHNSCHAQNATVYSISGTITFSSVFSGDLNEDDAERRLTAAEFRAEFADPRWTHSRARQELPSGSIVEGWFRFYFQRGQPAQPFQ